MKPESYHQEIRSALCRRRAATLILCAAAPWLCLAAGHGSDEAAHAVAGSDDRFAGYEAVVRATREASLTIRQQVLSRTVARNGYWIEGAWGDTLWSLAALYLNQKTASANERLLQHAETFLQARRMTGKKSEFLPETSQGFPWSYFGISEYVRILYLFGEHSADHPGRLRPETEAAMKEALWLMVKKDSRVADASLEDLLVTMGTENHDLNRRPVYYLVAGLFQDDPDFKDRPYDDGYMAAEHYQAYNTYFLAWPCRRAMSGLFIEVGSDTYQKYSYPGLLNLHDLSPDPDVRQRFGMLLDLAFIEEAQISVRGRRGGGRSRALFGKNNFEGYKNILYGDDPWTHGCSHSKVIETSTYQVPAAAILLRKMAFPAEAPFLIRNRVIGELDAVRSLPGDHDKRNPFVDDSALVNTCYRTPHYLLGSTLQDPSLSMPSPENGQPVLKYAGISRQNRWSGMLFDDPDARHPVQTALKNRADDELCAVFAEIEKTRGGRPQHPHWSFQHKNVLLLQRIPPPQGMGSYSTGKVSIRFHGKKLEKQEEQGWIFAGNGKAFVGVKFLDGGHVWGEAGEVAFPSKHDRARSTTRILFRAGDGSAYGSFAAFRRAVLDSTLTVDVDRVEYRSGSGSPSLEVFRYDPQAHEDFQLPRINGEPVDLRPEAIYSSPFLNGRRGSDRIAVTVGPIRRMYDFGKGVIE